MTNFESTRTALDGRKSIPPDPKTPEGQFMNSQRVRLIVSEYGIIEGKRCNPQEIGVSAKNSEGLIILTGVDA